MNRRDTAAGGLFIVLGTAFGLGALTQLNLGTPARMGPGFFPLMLSGVLVLLGLVTMLQGRGQVAPRPQPMPWRGLALIILAPVIFGLTVRGLGLVLSLVLVAGFTAYASRRMTHRLAFMLAVGLMLFCVAVFSYALGLPMERFGPWIRALSETTAGTGAP